MQTQYASKAFKYTVINSIDDPMDFYSWSDLKREVLTWTGVESTLRAWFFEIYGGPSYGFREEYDFMLFVDERLEQVMEQLGYGSVNKEQLQ